MFIIFNMNSIEITGLKDDIKTFIKIKKVENIDKKYVKVDKDNNFLTFIETKETKNGATTSNIIYEASKIFNEKDDYSLIYKNISENIIKDCLLGKNFSIISYGETESEKHSLMFYDNNINNINENNNENEKGIFIRLIENIFNEIDDNFYIKSSLFMVYNNKLIDLNKIIINNNLNNNIDFDIDNIINNNIIDIIIDSDFMMNKITKIKIENLNDFNNKFIQNYIKLFKCFKENDFYNIKNGIPNTKFPFIYSFSHFIYVIYFFDKKTNKEISNITLIELAGNDQMNFEINNDNNNKNNKKNKKKNTINNNIIINNKIWNTKKNIENAFTFENLKESISILKLQSIINNNNNSSSSNNNNTNENNNNNNIKIKLETKLIVMLKNLSFSKVNTKFYIFGCIFPNAGFKSTVKDTLNFILNINTISKSNMKKINIDQLESSIINMNEENKNKLISLIFNEIRNKKNEIKELKEINNQRLEKIILLEKTYSKQINYLAKIFGFKGDVNVLLSGNENSKEFKYVKKIKEIFDVVNSKNLQNEKLTENIEKLKNEIEKMKEINKIKLNDKHFVEYIQELKEKNRFEEEKFKIKMENDKNFVFMINENKRLNFVNEKIKNDVENKNNIIKNLAENLKFNIENKKNLNEIKEKIRFEIEEKFKKEIKEIYFNFENEKKISEEKLNNIIKNKENEINEIKEKIENLNNKNKIKFEEIYKENILFHYLLTNLIKKFKFEFGYFNNNNKLTNNKIVEFMKAKENFEKILFLTDKNINLMNFPLTLKDVIENNNNYNKILKNIKKDFDFDKKENINIFINNNINNFTFDAKNNNNIIKNNNNNNNIKKTFYINLKKNNIKNYNNNILPIMKNKTKNISESTSINNSLISKKKTRTNSAINLNRNSLLNNKKFT